MSEKGIFNTTALLSFRPKSRRYEPGYEYVSSIDRFVINCFINWIFVKLIPVGQFWLIKVHQEKICRRRSGTKNKAPVSVELVQV